MSRLINRNVTGATGRTSMRLEPELWDATKEICLRENRTLADMVQWLDGLRSETGIEGRTSALRVYVLEYFRAAATDKGHLAAGHGLLNQPVDTGWRAGAQELRA